MLSRLVVPALLFALTGQFDGCQSGSTGGPIPPGTTVGCFVDEDCTQMTCADVRCVSNQCTTVAAMRDGDGDGHAPIPCGDDCDDADTRVFPGADEVCDGVDQDCDMHIDEDAAPGVIATLLGTASLSLNAAPIGSSILLTDTSFTAGVRLRTLDFEGHVGAATPVLGESIEVVDVAGSGDAGLVVVGRAMGTGMHVIESYAVDLAGGVVTVHPATTVATLTDADQATRLGVEPVDTSFAIYWDDMASQRWVTMPSWPAPVMVSSSVTSVPFDLAAQGGTLAIPTTVTTIGFFRATDGQAMGTQSFATGLAASPITATSSDYLVAFRDAFDHQIAHLTPAAIGAMHAAPSQGSGLPLRIDETSQGPVITRFDASNMRRMGAGVFAIVLDPTLNTVRVDFPPTTVSRGIAGMPLSFDVVTSTTGTAVLTNFGMNGSVLAVLACQPQ